MYAMVPEGNGFWHNPDVPKYGQNLTRGERLTQAVELLKSAGFTYEQEPEISEDGNFVAKPGKGTEDAGWLSSSRDDADCSQRRV